MLTQRGFWASLLAAFLLVSAVDLHAPGETLDPLGHAREETYSLTARHPGQPAHFESSCDAKRPACPVCLHQQRTGGAHLLAAAALEPLARQAAGVNDLSLPSGHESRGPSGARGPPSV
ncbi:MAG TPA: hypothetical protein VGH73_00925 [Thermoanaerobaculia bacterium]|jgi:hypothetical protein